MTNEQLMNITGAKCFAIDASLKRLEDKNILIRDTKLVMGNGKASTRRILYLRENYRDAILINNICNVENQHVKDKQKNKLKDKENIILEEQSSSNTKTQSIRYY